MGTNVRIENLFKLAYNQAYNEANDVWLSVIRLRPPSAEIRYRRQNYRYNQQENWTVEPRKKGQVIEHYRRQKVEPRKKGQVIIPPLSPSSTIPVIPAAISVIPIVSAGSVYLPAVEANIYKNNQMANNATTPQKKGQVIVPPLPTVNANRYKNSNNKG